MCHNTLNTRGASSLITAGQMVLLWVLNLFGEVNDVVRCYRSIKYKYQLQIGVMSLKGDPTPVVSKRVPDVWNNIPPVGSGQCFQCFLPRDDISAVKLPHYSTREFSRCSSKYAHKWLRGVSESVLSHWNK